MKYRFEFDEERCIACGACAVACMDQHDTDLKAGDPPFRKVAVKEDFLHPGKKAVYVSSGCLHCEDAPCITACPTGCLQKNGMGLTVYDKDLCIGCRSCEAACQYDVPAFGADGKIAKCDGCAERLRNGLEPACVRVCPTKALKVISED